MAPGIVIQHARLPDRQRELVRSDITAILGFVKKARWPEGASAGDYLELILRREGDLWAHPDRKLFDPASRRAVKGFFANGGDTCHLIGICVESDADLQQPDPDLGVLAPLFDRLRAEEDVAIMLVPAASYMRCQMDRDGEIRCDAEPLYNALLGHCREMNNRFLVIDAPKDLHGDLLIRWARQFRRRQAGLRSFAALYYPWLMDGDDLFPPSGVMAGSYAGLELANPPYGVAQPPANIVLEGVTHTQLELTWAEAGALLDEAVNPIVVQGGRGVVAFGARTLSLDVTWKHINSRRVVNMVLEQLRRDSEWAVFETNNPHLWDVLERDVLFRLGQLAGGGMLTGSRPGEDYNVKCDRENNLPALRDAGQVNVRLRMQPVGTVEQIVVDLRIGANDAAGGT